MENSDRYAFVRSKDPFAGIEDYSHSGIIGVHNNRIDFPSVQLSLLEGGVLKRGDITKISGYFFERISQGINGGKIQASVDVFKNSSNGDVTKRTLDVISNKLPMGREVKSAYNSNKVQLINWQLAGYAYMILTCPETSSEEGKDIHEIYVDIFRHGLKKIEEYSRKSLDSLVSDLTQNIRNLISLPFSVIFNAWYPIKTPYYTYDKGKRAPYTSFKSKDLNMFLVEPNKALRNLNLNPIDYEIIKGKFPQGVIVNNNKICPFPILIIREKNHSGWLRGFKETYRNHAPLFLNYMCNDNVGVKDFSGELFDLGGGMELESPDGDMRFDFGVNKSQPNLDLLDNDEPYLDIPF